MDKLGHAPFNQSKILSSWITDEKPACCFSATLIHCFYCNREFSLGKAVGDMTITNERKHTLVSRCHNPTDSSSSVGSFLRMRPWLCWFRSLQTQTTLFTGRRTLSDTTLYISSRDTLMAALTVPTLTAVLCCTLAHTVCLCKSIQNMAAVDA